MDCFLSRVQHHDSVGPEVNPSEVSPELKVEVLVFLEPAAS